MEGSRFLGGDLASRSSSRASRDKRPFLQGRRRFRSALAVVLFAGITIATIRFAYAAIFGTLQPYDDEGFHLLSLRTYLTGHELYDEVFAQYGPFYYQAMGAVFRFLGTLPTHDSGRLLTLSLWIGGSLLAGYALFRLTDSLFIGLVVQGGVFVTLYTLVNEPMHPGGLLVALLIAIVAVSVLVVPKRRGLGTLLIGALAMATALVKVNVGSFALLSIALSVCVVFPALETKRTIRVVISSVFVVTPFALMLRDLEKPWAKQYALLVAMAALSVVSIANRVRPSRSLRGPELVWLAGGIAAVAVVVPVLVIAQGTSPGGLLTGLLIDPLRQADIFTVPLRLPVWSMLLGAGSLAFALVAPRWWTRGSVLSGLASLGGGMAMLLGVLGPPPFGPLSLGLALPMTWLSVWAMPSDEGGMALVLMPSLAVLQALHGYPVAGSQVAWSMFLLVPAGAIAVWGGQRQLAGALGQRSRAIRAIRSFVWAPLLAFTVWFAVTAVPSLERGVTSYSENVSLDLPGAHRLRLPADQTWTVRHVTAGLREHCSTFVSLPGLNSFHFFAEQEPPTAMNQSGWMYVFGEQVQSSIVREIASVERLCALRNTAMVDFWRQGRPLPKRPLVTYIDDAFQLFTRWGDYDLLLRAHAQE